MMRTGDSVNEARLVCQMFSISIKCCDFVLAIWPMDGQTDRRTDDRDMMKHLKTNVRKLRFENVLTYFRTERDIYQNVATAVAAVTWFETAGCSVGTNYLNKK